MIPGFSNALMPPGHEKESGAKIKRYMCIMDSMTDKELDSSDPKLFSVSNTSWCCRAKTANCSQKELNSKPTNNAGYWAGQICHRPEAQHRRQLVCSRSETPKSGLKKPAR